MATREIISTSTLLASWVTGFILGSATVSEASGFGLSSTIVLEALSNGYVLDSNIDTGLTVSGESTALVSTYLTSANILAIGTSRFKD